MNIDENKLHELLGKFVGDLGATLNAGSIVIGEKLGLYKAMSKPREVRDLKRTRKPHRHERTLCSRMAECERGGRLH